MNNMAKNLRNGSVKFSYSASMFDCKNSPHEISL